MELYTFVHFCTLFVHYLYTFVHSCTLFVHYCTLFVHFCTLLYTFVHYCTLFVHLTRYRVYIQCQSTNPLLFIGTCTSKQWRLIFVYDVARPWQVDSHYGIIVSVVKLMQTKMKSQTSKQETHTQRLQTKKSSWRIS